MQCHRLIISSLSLSLSVPHTHYILHCVFIILISVVVVVDPLNFSGFRNVCVCVCGGGGISLEEIHTIFFQRFYFFAPVHSQSEHVPAELLICKNHCSLGFFTARL